MNFFSKIKQNEENLHYDPCRLKSVSDNSAYSFISRTFESKKQQVRNLSKPAESRNHNCWLLTVFIFQSSIHISSWKPSTKLVAPIKIAIIHRDIFSIKRHRSIKTCWKMINWRTSSNIEVHVIFLSLEDFNICINFLTTSKQACNISWISSIENFSFFESKDKYRRRKMKEDGDRGEIRSVSWNWDGCCCMDVKIWGVWDYFLKYPIKLTKFINLPLEYASGRNIERREYIWQTIKEKV